MANIFSRPRAGWLRLVIYLMVFPGLAILVNGWVFSGDAIEWSRTVANPDWAPPPAFIGSVWVVVFTLMAIALWLVDRDGEIDKSALARSLILTQYAINLSWPFLYFVMESVFNGFWATGLAWIVSIATTWAVLRANRQAGYLILPLTAWLTYALPLSFFIWRLNSISPAG